MALVPAPFELQLAQRSLYRVNDAAGVRFTCREGVVWITLDNDLRDIVLEAGQHFTGDAHRKALIYAMRPSSLRIAPAQAPQSGQGLQLESPLQFQPAPA
ncbi:MAG TPA: DUF2917 domain-containing protein [Ramlibacter sp.]|nr:DUF2917 domain-containing protein [Ramlibacter sp.]